MPCSLDTIILPTSSYTIPLDTNLAVVTKFKELSEAALATDSIYMRAKDTFKELFEGKKINEQDYANLAASFASDLATQTIQTAMQTALGWAKEDIASKITLETLKNQSELIMAQREKIKLEMCALESEIELRCATIKTTYAASMRDNGKILTTDPNNPCIPLTLADEGTKYEQMKYIQTQEYANLADAFRKSGIVHITTDTDGITKGTTGDNAGYTDAQEEFARRQVKSFEDSKRNHAVNAISQMIGQMLSAETPPTVEDVNRWRTAVDYLIINTP